MSDNETTQVTEEAKPKDEAKGLRGQLEKSLETTNKYRSMLLDSAYEKLQLDPSKGLGKAIAKEYEGDPSFEALSEYAKEEYDYSIPEQQAAEHPAQQQITQGHAALEQIGDTSGSITPPTEQDALAVAESNRDNNATLAYKGAELERMMRQN